MKKLHKSHFQGLLDEHTSTRITSTRFFRFYEKMLFSTMKKIAYLLLLLFIFSTKTQAQQVINTENLGFFMEGGYGAFNQRSEIVYGKALWLTFSNKNKLFKFRYQHLDRFEGESTKLQFSQYSDNYALMIGNKSGNKYIHVGASVGLGITNGVYQGAVSMKNTWFGTTSTTYKKDEFTMISLPLELDVVVKPFPGLGLGFALTGDINKEKTNFGALMKVGLGLY